MTKVQAELDETKIILVRHILRKPWMAFVNCTMVLMVVLSVYLAQHHGKPAGEGGETG